MQKLWHRHAKCMTARQQLTKWSAGLAFHQVKSCEGTKWKCVSGAMSLRHPLAYKALAWYQNPAPKVLTLTHPIGEQLVLLVLAGLC